MRLDIYHHMVYDDNCQELDIKKSLESIFHNLKQITMDNAELLALLLADDAKVDKIITEIQALKDLVAASKNVPQDIVDAVNNLGTKLQAADDLNDDSTPES